MSNRRIWSAADKRAIVAEAEEPDATVSMVARRHNTAHRRYWLLLTVRDAIPNRNRSQQLSSPPCACG